MELKKLVIPLSSNRTNLAHITQIKLMRRLSRKKTSFIGLGADRCNSYKQTLLLNIYKSILRQLNAHNDIQTHPLYTIPL